MSEFYWLWAYITAFWTTVVVQCAKPVNWDQCSQVNDWLVPWARDAMDMRKNGAYHSERKILKQSNGLGRLDDGESNP
jgi:hypothetical protein